MILCGGDALIDFVPVTGPEGNREFLVHARKGG